MRQKPLKAIGGNINFLSKQFSVSNFKEKIFLITNSLFLIYNIIIEMGFNIFTFFIDFNMYV